MCCVSTLLDVYHIVCTMLFASGRAAPLPSQSAFLGHGPMNVPYVWSQCRLKSPFFYVISVIKLTTCDVPKKFIVGAHSLG